MDAKDFVPIRVSTLRGDKKISFDVYVHIAGKFILYCRQGSSFEGQRLARLKEKKLKKMFIVRDNERSYRSYLNENIEMAYDGSKDKPIETRAEIIQGAQQAATEDAMENPDSKEFYDVAKEGSRRYVDFILNEQQSLKYVLLMENADHSASHHGVNVATLALGMAKKLGYTKSHPMNLLVLGCLLHDIEHLYNPVPLGLAAHEMKPEDLDVYRSHPTKGSARITESNFYDKIVTNIILQHEEYIDGSGFPKGLKDTEMEPLSVLASTANSFDRYMSFQNLSAKEALKRILIEKMGMHPLKQLQSLQEVLKEEGLL